MKIRIKIVVFLYFFCFFSITTYSQVSKFKAEKGVLDLREVDFSEEKVIRLGGEWEFYWNKLYSYKDFENEVHTPDAYITVPGGWSNVKIEGKQIPDTGFCTYRLVLFVKPNTEENFMISFGEILSTYSVWWNSKNILNMGSISTNSKTNIPQTKSIYTNVAFDQEKIQIIIQIANYEHRTNGIFITPAVGKEKNIIIENSKLLILDLIGFGAILIMIFYHLGLFVVRTKNKAALVFSILAFVVCIRILVTSYYSLSYFFPSISWNIIFRLSYITYYSLVPLFLLFLKVTFNENKNKWLFYTSYIISGVFILSVLLPTYTFTRLIIFYQVANLLMIIYVVVLLVKYIFQKRLGAKILSLSIIILFIFGINDILFYNNFIQSITLTNFGFVVLALGQTLTLARIFTNEFLKNEKLTEELDFHNKHLQDLVKERTKEIEIKNQDILQKNEELMMQKEELQVQKEEILKQKELVDFHNKFVTESIKYASTIQKSLLPSNQQIREYFNSFIIYMPKNIVSGDFYWFSDFNSKYIFVSVGDCTGHGVPGAFLSIIGIYLFNSIIVELKKSEPNEILDELDKQFSIFLSRGDNNNRDGMELSVVRFEKNAFDNLTFAGAKSDIIIFNSEKAEINRYKGTRKSIGSNKNNNNLENIVFENKNVKLSEKDTIYLFSDGYIDQNNSERKRYGSASFENLLNEIATYPLQQQKVLLIKKLEEHQKVEDQRDDITILGISKILNE